jgi:hypothetical protein
LLFLSRCQTCCSLFFSWADAFPDPRHSLGRCSLARGNVSQLIPKVDSTLRQRIRCNDRVSLNLNKPESTRSNPLFGCIDRSSRSLSPLSSSLIV